MRDAIVHPGDTRMRWVELPGDSPVRVYVHGLGATSPAYYAGVAAHPLLAGRRSLLIDLLGFGISDRPLDFGYTLEEHADALAQALHQAGATGAQLIAHSMGGAVAIVLATRHPELVSRLVLVDANLDPARPGSSVIAGYTEEDFVTRGWEAVRDRVGAHWWSTMRLADRRALYRTAVHRARDTTPTMRAQLMALSIPRAYLHPDNAPPSEVASLRASGVNVIEIPNSGHNIMLDNPDGFAEAVAALLS